MTTGVRCRGSCKNGHTTEAVAEPGRVTWHGPCATAGCDLKVYCRRVPADIPPAPPETRTATTDPHRVLEVPGYRDDPIPAAAGGDDDDASGGSPDDASDTAGGESGPVKPPRKRRRPAAAGSPAPPVSPTPPRPDAEPRGFAARLRARLAGGDDDDDDESLFGVY